jgi:CubicO group peptidase (beta-lactamase class C family)
MRFCLCVAALSLALAVPANALTVEEAVNRFAASLVDAVDFPGGVSVGVYHRGQVTFYNFGVADDEERPVTERTIFEIGSVTKTFTATLFGNAINTGRIDPNASITAELPAGLSLQSAAQAVTPFELATFTSGLPDDPPDLPREIRRRGIEYYTVADFFAFLSDWTPAGPLPAPYLYSNTGVGLLGFLVAGSIEGWEQQVGDFITAPLGMVDTAVHPAMGEPERHARGFARDGRPAPQWPLYAWAAAGALRSTATDLVRFVAANLGHSVDGSDPSDALIAAMRLTHEPAFQIWPDRPTYQALTWRVRKSGNGPEEIVFKDGGTAGFSSFIGFNPAKDLGVVILANWNDAPVVDAGVDLIGHVNDGQ